MTINALDFPQKFINIVVRHYNFLDLIISN